MPPKRQPSTRSSARISANDIGAGDVADDTKPGENESAGSTELELPSDPAAAAFESVDPSNSANILSAGDAIDANPSTTDANVSLTSATRKKLLSQPKRSGRRTQARLQELQRTGEEGTNDEAGTNTAEDIGRVRRAGKTRDDGRGGRGGAGFRGRGRGRGSGNSRQPVETIAEGPFGAAQATKIVQSRGASAATGRRQRGNRSSAASNGTPGMPANNTGNNNEATTSGERRRIKEESESQATFVAKYDDGDGSMRPRPYIKSGDAEYISSDEDEEQRVIQRLNVEDLGIIDLTRGNDDTKTLPPVRVTRVEHRQKALGINADGATNTEGAITVDANDTAVLSSWQKKGKQRAKDITAERHIFQATYSDSDSDVPPDVSIKVDPEAQSQVPSADNQLKEPPSSPESRRKGKAKVKARTLSDDSFTDRPDNLTHDEAEEWERHQKDLHILRNELGAPASVDIDQDGDLSMTGFDKRADKVYLFQLPPMLPDLSPIPVKPDPATEAEGMLNIEENGQAMDEVQMQPPSGAIGKMKVHASGRVTFDWGGMNLCLGMGSQATFSQQVVVANLPDTKPEDEEEAVGGLVTALGEVQHKFVVTPDFEEILR